MLVSNPDHPLQIWLSVSLFQYCVLCLVAVRFKLQFIELKLEGMLTDVYQC